MQFAKKRFKDFSLKMLKNIEGENAHVLKDFCFVFSVISSDIEYTLQPVRLRRLLFIMITNTKLWSNNP